MEITASNLNFYHLNIPTDINLTLLLKFDSHSKSDTFKYLYLNSFYQ